MGLTVITGGPNAGKTGIVYDTVRQAVAAGRSVQLLLPTLPDVRRAQQVLASDCPLGLEVGQLDRAIETQWELRGDGRRLVTKAERGALLARAWSEFSGQAAPGRGLTRVLASLARRASGPAVRQAGNATAAEIVGALAAYRRLLDRDGLIEFADAALLLARSAAASADLVVVHRFSDLGREQEAMIVGWAGSTDVVVTMPFDADVPATRLSSATVERLEHAGAAVRHCPATPTGIAEFDALATRLFGLGGAVEPSGAVSLWVAQGEEAEARAVADAVALALRKGTPPERIAVAFRDPARHYGWLRRALEERDVPADFDVQLPLAETPLGGAILRLWAFVTGGYRRADLGAFLRSPYSDMSADAIDIADERWRASRTPDGPGLVHALGDKRVAGLVKAMDDLARRPVDSDAVTVWQELAGALYSNGYPGEAPTPGGTALVDAAVHRTIVASADALSQVEGATAHDVVAELRAARVSRSAVEHAGHVQVMSVERLCTRRFDVVVLGGLTASEFPRSDTGDVLEGDAIQEAMDCLEIPRDPSEETARERLLFALAVTRARRSLVLVRQGADEEGRALRRSVFWDEALDIYRDPHDPEDMSGPELTEVLADVAAGGHESGARARVLRGDLDAAAVRAIAGELDVVSASEIEAYLACPYRWFMERVIRPRAPDLEIDGRVRGMIAHDALARFYRRLPEALGCRRVTAEIVADALALAADVTAEALRSAPDPRTLEERESFGRVARCVARLVEKDAAFLPGYEPVAVEWSFGRDDPVELGPFRLTGRADRIDSGPEGLVVIDYKTSSATPVARFEREGKVQLQLYAIAASRHFGSPVAGGLYRSLSAQEDRGFLRSDVASPGISRTDRCDEDAIEALLETSVSSAARAVEGMRCGRIEPAPDARKCSWCTASGYCPEGSR
jgi:RecB family exonuclease